MEPVAVLCPACQHRLRVRERAFLNRPIDCPACGTAIRIDVARDGAVAVSQVAISPPEPSVVSASRVAPVAPETDRVPEDIEPKRTPGTRVPPRLIAWGITLGVACIVLGWAWWHRKGPPPTAVAQTKEKPVADVPDAQSSAAPGTPSVDNAQGHVPSPVGTASAVPRPQDPTAVLTVRLESLGREVLAFQTQNEVFPFAQPVTLPPPQRLSWMATLLSASARPGARIDLSWNAPENEPFVRRRRDPFLNPLESALVGDDGYPASHFAGSAGIGSNARKLRVDEPGAGAFGEDRRTRREDFRDGLAQTILIVGVTDSLGSWAANDRSTLREWTREPYVNGPDGLGTGQPESMLVLMADGSVRTVSAKTDGAVVRQMVTLWDAASPRPEESLVASRENTPPDSPMPESPHPNGKVDVAKPVDEKPQGDQPLGGVVPEGEPDDLPAKPVVILKDRLAIENALRRNVLKYEVTRPVERGLLVRELADLAGISLNWNDGQLGARKARLKESVTLKSGPAELGRLIDQLLAPVGLRLEPRDGAAWIIPSPVDDNDNPRRPDK